MKLLPTALLAIAFASSSGLLAQNKVQQEREQKVADDVRKMRTNDLWIYNDFAKAKQIATDSKKPMLVVFR